MLRQQEESAATLDAVASAKFHSNRNHSNLGVKGPLSWSGLNYAIAIKTHERVAAASGLVQYFKSR